MNFSKMDLQDFYNFMLDSGSDPLALKATGLLQGILMKYSNYLPSKDSSNGGLNSLMNGVIREKLKIIPKNVM